MGEKVSGICCVTVLQVLEVRVYIYMCVCTTIALYSGIV